MGEWVIYLASFPSLSYVAYEGGESMLISSNTSPQFTPLCNLDNYSGIETITETLLQTWINNFGNTALFEYFHDAQTCGFPSSFGLSPTPDTASTAFKYLGALNKLQ